jgi:hypothetical protein
VSDAEQPRQGRDGFDPGQAHDRARRALELGCMLAINCDVHSPGDYDNLRFGVMTARRAGAPAGRVVNTLDHDTLHKWLRREVRLSTGRPSHQKPRPQLPPRPPSLACGQRSPEP